MKFNFTRLHAPFMEAIKQKNASIVFSLRNGRGRFVFMLFIPSDNAGQILWKKLDAYIILGRTQAVINPELSGFYTQGRFDFKFSEDDEAAIREELDINHAEGGNFEFATFYESLNQEIPQTVPLVDCIRHMQENSQVVERHCAKHLEHADRRFLLSHQPLPPNKKPRDETLRKLIYLARDPRVVSGMIAHLKRLNWTLKWTDADPGGDRFAAIWEKALAT